VWEFIPESRYGVGDLLCALLAGLAVGAGLALGHRVLVAIGIALAVSALARPIETLLVARSALVTIEPAETSAEER
jgi:hypothetical protein